MASTFERIINNMDGRYPTPDEEQRIGQFVESLPKRLAAVRALEQHEDGILEACIKELKQRYPQLHQSYPTAWEKAYRDMQMVLRYNAQGLLGDDENLAADKLLYWMRTILTSSGMTGDFLADVYAHLRQSVQKHLPAEAFAFLEPHLSKTVEVLRGSPDPALAMA
ncbi:MAG: hypothetical protein ACFCD0_27150 [Gemmataceae bacterium]